jgi:hypothetical protein
MDLTRVTGWIGGTMQSTRWFPVLVIFIFVCIDIVEHVELQVESKFKDDEWIWEQHAETLTGSKLGSKEETIKRNRVTGLSKHRSDPPASTGLVIWVFSKSYRSRLET